MTRLRPKHLAPVIALIKGSPNRAAAKQALMERVWEPGMVTGMLGCAGADASRAPGSAPAPVGLPSGQGAG